MVEINEIMAKATPEELAAIHAPADAQVTYELNAAHMLKKQGNELHSHGKFRDASQKYLLAKNKLKDIPVAKGRTLLLACSLNLMSCYLKTKQFDDCINEGSEVLAYDGANVKALYRRGQAYKELGKLEVAVSDLSKAHEISPDDRTITDVLRDANERLTKEGGDRYLSGRFEEISKDEIRSVPSQCHKISSSIDYSVTQLEEAGKSSQGDTRGPTMDAECFQILNGNPAPIRSYHNFVLDDDPNSQAALSVSVMAPDMVKIASDIISKMSPDDLQRMIEVASSFNGKSTLSPMARADAKIYKSNIRSQLSHEMSKTAFDMIEKISPEELQKVLEVVSSLNGKPLKAKTDTFSQRSKTGSQSSAGTEIPVVNENAEVGQTSSCGLFLNSRMGLSFSTLPTSAAHLEEQTRNQMKDPATRQMFTSMTKHVSSDKMTNISEQLGVKLSKEEVEEAQPAMSLLSQDDSDKMFVVMGSNTEPSNALMATDMGVEADIVEYGPTLGVELPVSEANEMVENFVGSEITATEESANIEPFVGMQFESEEAAKIFYNAYARCVGFSIRVGHNRRSKRDGENISRQFVCSREGFRQKKYINREDRIMPPRPDTRNGCKAMVMVNRRGPNKWVVSKFEKYHNHNLESPSKVHYLQSQRHVSNNANGHIDRSQDAFVAPPDIMSAFVEETVGIRNVGFTERDCRKYMGTVRRRILDKGDAQTVLDYFKHMQAENPAFFYAIQVDEEERMTNFFWADARSRMAYDYFGDVVTFDTTFKTNLYRIPFAPFMGVNHHKQPVVFGCALLQDESEASYIWLFKTWLDAMSGRHPKSIITDQDLTLGAAVAKVFPETTHRLYMWNILNKIRDFCHAPETFEGDFDTCINHSVTVEEFESSWGLLVDRYELRENRFIQSLYDIRQKWVPAYLRNAFFAGISTTQQSQSMDYLFDGYLTAYTTLQEFFTQSEKALDNRYTLECEADFKSCYTEPALKTPLPMEQQAAEVYTGTMFSEFQEELLESLSYIPTKAVVVGESSTYRVAKFGDDNRSYSVTFNESEKRASCTCLMFEFTGILCRHALIVFRILNVLKLPSYYILKRWTKTAKNRVLCDDQGVDVQSNRQGSLILRYNNLCNQAIKYAEEGATSADIYSVAVRALRKALEEVISAKKDVAKGAEGTSDSGNIEQDHCMVQSRAIHSANLMTSLGLRRTTGKRNHISACGNRDDRRHKCPTLKGGRSVQPSGNFDTKVSQVGHGVLDITVDWELNSSRP